MPHTDPEQRRAYSRERSRRRRKTDPEKIREYDREWRRKRHQKDPEKRRAKDREKYAASSEPFKVKSRMQTAKLTEEQRVRIRERVNAKNRANPLLQRAAKLKNTYGLSVIEVSRMLRDQDCKCLICSRPFDFSHRISYVVDHSHQTGRVRGLLCNRCNVGIGLFQDNPGLCRIAAEYLDKFGG